MIQKRNLEACEHAYEYWKQNTTHSIEVKTICLELAKQLMALIKTSAPVSEFLVLQQKCEEHQIDKMGYGGFGLHSAIIAVLSDLGS